MTKNVARLVLLLSGLLLFSQLVLANMPNVYVPAYFDKDGRAVVPVGRQAVLNPGLHLEYLEDPDGNLSFDQVKLLDDVYWQKSTMSVPNFGYTTSAYWFRFRLVAHDEPLSKLLTIQYPLLDSIHLFILDRGQLKREFLTGDSFPFEQRPVRHRDFLFPIDFEAHQTLELFLRIKTEGSLQIPIKLWERDQFVWADQDEMLMKAAYYGMMFVLMVYNLFLFLSIRERSYLYYCGLVLSILILMTAAHGFLFQYIYPNSPQIQQLMLLLAVPSTMLFAGLFAGYFLSLSKVSPGLNRLLIVSNVVFSLSFLGAFLLPYDISTRISVFLSIPASLLIMYSGIYAWSHGQASARYFIYAWAFLIAGIVVSASSKAGILPRNNFTEYALNWGSAIEALLLSFALADRFNRERQAKFKAQHAQLEEQKQRKTAEQKLYAQSTHQALDGFPNAVLLQQILYRMIYMSPAESAQFALFFLQLNGIAEINKTLGHENADVVISLFSKRLQALNAAYDRAVLIEAGEHCDYYFSHVEKGLFVHVLKDVEINRAVDYARELMERVADPVDFKGMKLDLDLSIGIASYPVHGKGLDEIMRHARVALDLADHSHGKIGVYSADINPYSERRLVLMGELKKAIDNNTLALHYQPIIASDTGQIAGVEALLRWHHEILGFIPPDEFIVLAEKTGIMCYLTQWVLQQAIQDHAQRRIVFGSSTLSVNISAVNLHEPDFVSNVMQLLDRYDVPAEELILEITETSVMKDPDYAVSALKRLAENAIKLAIDDFGTGYSSLSYIQQLPLYEIKIDRSFIQQMEHEKGDQIIVKTTLGMSKDLGFRVVAEGIENFRSLSALRAMQCDFLQGFYIARPMALEALNDWQTLMNSEDLLKEQKS